MATTEKLMELLRRAHTAIGEALIENALDESAEGLHNEIADVLGIPVVKRDTVRCGATWFVAGGRMSRQCREIAVDVCVECGNARCEDHGDLYLEERDGRTLLRGVPAKEKGGSMSTQKKSQPSVSVTDTKKKWDPFQEWDVITGTTDGGVIWRRYGDGLIVLARRGENPNDALERHLRREREERERQHELPPLPPSRSVN